MLVSSIAIHIVAISFINQQRNYLKTTPKIIHDDDDGSNPSHRARYNKAIVTLKALYVWLIFLFFGLFLLYIFSRAKRKYLHCIHFTDLWYILIFNLFTYPLAGQTLKQLVLWLLLGPFHTFGTQSYILYQNKPLRTYLKRAIYDCKPEHDLQSCS